MAPRYDYLRDPEAIYRRSFEIVRRESDLAGLPDDIALVVQRLVHACGMPEIVADLRYSDDVARSSARALRAGARPLRCDRVASQRTRPRLPLQRPPPRKRGPGRTKLRQPIPDDL